MSHPQPVREELEGGITKAGEGYEGTEWRVLGHTYYAKVDCASSFSFETVDPPGTFVPPHIHPTQDEFIYMLEGEFDLYLDGAWTKASAGDLVRMPKGKPHGYYNRTEQTARALFWVSPAGRLAELFGKLHDLTDEQLVVQYSSECDVDFLPPGSVEGA